MNLHVCLILELLSQEIIRVLTQDLLSLLNGTVHTFRSRSKYKLCTVSTKQIAPFKAHRFRHNNNSLVAFGCSNKCQANPCVPAGSFYNGAAWLQQPFLLSLFHNADRDTVFHAGARVLIFQLQVDFSRTFRNHPVETNERCASDQICYTVDDFSHE
ncbi:hypothetical protein D3C75_878340 [compost metagenome]